MVAANDSGGPKRRYGMSHGIPQVHQLPKMVTMSRDVDTVQ